MCESTYGGRDRFERARGSRADDGEEIRGAAARKGAMLIPSFAVERTQEMVTDMIALMDQARVPKANVFIDRPLAKRPRRSSRKHAKSLENGDELCRAFRSPHVR